MTCPAWEDGEHYFEPGYMVRDLSMGQSFAELMTKSRYPDTEIQWRFVATDARMGHPSVDARRCRCGLIVKTTRPEDAK